MYFISPDIPLRLAPTVRIFSSILQRGGKRERETETEKISQIERHREREWECVCVCKWERERRRLRIEEREREGGTCTEREAERIGWSQREIVEGRDGRGSFYSCFSFCFLESQSSFSFLNCPQDSLCSSLYSSTRIVDIFFSFLPVSHG